MIVSARKKGMVFVVSSPSGAGKNTVISALMEREPRLECSVSATTRSPRKGEEHGREYFFLGKDEFERRVSAGDFVEWAEVHGNLYGTLREELERLTDSGKDALLELDVQGMANLRGQGLDFVSVFIMPPSMEELERRLTARGTDSEEVIALRMRNARGEIEFRKEYDYTVINDRVDDAVADFAAIVRAERCRSERYERQ